MEATNSRSIIMIATAQSTPNTIAYRGLMLKALTSANASETPAIAPVTTMTAPRPKYFGRSVGHLARSRRFAPASQ